MKKPTIYDIKYLTKESLPYYFSRDTLKCFNQTLKDFYVHPLHKGHYKISAPSYWGGKLMGVTIMYFNPISNTLNQDYSYG